METLHNSQYYAAHLHPRAGLIIESKRKTGGIRLTSDHPQYAEWVGAIKTAIDSFEADAICKALLSN